MSLLFKGMQDGMKNKRAESENKCPVYTKGEWEFKSIPKEHRQLIRTKDTKMYVAELQTTGDEANANATLIAAAPDLLEALQAMVDSFGYYDLELTDEEGIEAINKAKNAIKKATE